MYISIFIFFINIFVFYILNKRIKSENDYNKEKIIFYKLKIKKINRIINIGYIVINCVYYIIIMLSINFDNYLLMYLIFFLLSISSYIFVELKTNIKRNRLKLIDKKIINKKDYMCIICFLILFVTEKTSINYNITNIDMENFINTFNMIIYCIGILLIMISLFLIINYSKKNSRYFRINNTTQDYLEDIGFYKKIEINKIFNHVIYITAYIVFFYANIPYIFIFYIVTLLVLIYFMYNKIKKIKNESSRVYKSVTIAHNKPGIVYAFEFTKDLLLIKKIFIFIVLLLSSILAYYGLGESVFALLSISIYLILLYTIIEDKIYLIRYLSSLNSNFINEKEYSILENKKIDYIESINILGIKLYKLIIIDTIIYESNIIIYDPELMIDNIDIRINKSNILDYYTLETLLYEE